MKYYHRRLFWCAVSLVGLIPIGCSCDGSDSKPLQDDAGNTAETGPWLVFETADLSFSELPNLLKNGDFEQTKTDTELTDWSVYGTGYSVGRNQGRAGNAVVLRRGATTEDTAGAHQYVEINQDMAKPLRLSGWSRAENVTGNPSAGASIYVDFKYKTKAQDPVNGCPESAENKCFAYARLPNPLFDTGTHDWQFREGLFIPSYPVHSAYFYVLLRDENTGTLWFDDLSLQQIEHDLYEFDNHIVVTKEPEFDFRVGDPVSVSTEDGLGIELWSGSGALRNVTIDGNDLLYKRLDHASGFFVQDVTTGQYWAPGGSITTDATSMIHAGTIEPLSVSLKATYQPTADSIRIKAEVTSLSLDDRAISLYYALPVEVSSWKWGDYIRKFRPANQQVEMINSFDFRTPVGATGRTSRYPFGTVFDEKNGLAIGYPLDQARVSRIVYNSSTRQFFISFDLGLTKDTLKNPSKASVELVLYRTRHNATDHGFRSALDGYYKRHTNHFARRIPAEQEGIWVAFADLSKIENNTAAGESLKDFHIGFHEGSVRDVAFDDEQGINTFRYLGGPTGEWFQIADPNVDIHNGDQVIDWLQRQQQHGSPKERVEAEQALTSAMYGSDNRMDYRAYDEGPPWCRGRCIFLSVNGDPEIEQAPYQANHAKSIWNDEVAKVYDTTHPGLDGEYIDTFLMFPRDTNFRRSHFAFADIPLTFTKEAPHQVVQPYVFTALEMTRWVKSQIPEGKYYIANGILDHFPWGAELFDFFGLEVKWVKEETGYKLVTDTDTVMSYRRSLAAKRPYGYLLNVDFTRVTKQMVEQYMRTCLFYGFYPSMFSHNASENNYFETPALYQRDRELFKKYIPLIKQLNRDGWEPMTHARASDDQVYIERFGAWPASLHFTLRNEQDSAVKVKVHIDRHALGITGAAKVVALVTPEPEIQLSADTNEFEISLQAHDVQAIQIVNP